MWRIVGDAADAMGAGRSRDGELNGRRAADRALTGRMGEDAALECLLGNGMSLMERNWRWRHLEIDLIMLAADGVHIVEVRTRHIPSPVSPEWTVDRRKQRRVENAAAAYVRLHKIDMNVHFDIVSVKIDGGGVMTVEHIPDAFYPFR